MARYFSHREITSRQLPSAKDIGWLAGQIQVQRVGVSSGPGGDDSQILIQIDYLLIETQSKQTTEVIVH